MSHTQALSSFMGLVIAFTGAYFLYQLLFTPGYESYPGEMTSDLILIVGGVFLIAAVRKDLRKSTTWALMTIGLSTIAGSVYYVFYTTDIMNVALANVYLILSVILVYYSISLIFNTSAGSTKGLICLGILAAVQIVPILYRLYMGDDIVEQIKDSFDRIVRGVAYLVVIFILTRKTMALETLPRRMNRNSNYLYDVTCTPSDAYVDIKDYQKLVDLPEEGWTPCKSGPIESEMVIPLYNTALSIRLQKMRSNEDVYAAFCSGDAESYRVALSIPMRSVKLDEPDESNRGKLRIYGDDGVFVDLMILDYGDQPKGYIGTYRYNSQKAREKRKEKKESQPEDE